MQLPTTIPWPRVFLLFSAVLGVLCVLAGIVGAHVLPEATSDKLRASWQMAVIFHGFHALSLLGLASWARERTGWRIIHAGVLFAVGTLLFCVTIYLRVLTESKGWPLPIMTAAAPWGGTAWMAAWTLLGVEAVVRK